MDNDGDGQIDAADTGCPTIGFDQTQPEDPECSNGVDDDGDELVDHPNDPGCANTLAGKEEPECSDGVDNDGNGDVDYPEDPDCESPAGTSESACGLLGIESLLAMALLKSRRKRRRA